MGFEPMTFSLARRCSTTELRPLKAMALYHRFCGTQVQIALPRSAISSIREGLLAPGLKCTRTAQAIDFPPIPG